MDKSVFEKHPEMNVGKYKLKAISYADEKEVEELCSSYPPERRISAIELIDKVGRQYKEHSGINWGIYSNGELAGTMGFYRGFENDQGELGYVLREKFRNKGIGTAIAKELVKIGFEKMKLKSIEAYTGIENLPSQKLLIAAGFARTEHPDKKTAAFRIEK